MKLRLVLDVVYDLNGVNVDWLKDQLNYLADHAANEGLLTGSSSATVEGWASAVKEVE